MQEHLEDILDNVLGLLLLQGSYEIEEDEENLNVSIETDQAGRLIGFRGESLTALQYLVNQILSKKTQGEDYFKRVVIDIGNWRKQKEEDLAKKTKDWIGQVSESKEELALEPMPSWQRRIVHMVVSESKGVESESVGEGRERHLVIRPSK